MYVNEQLAGSHLASTKIRPRDKEEELEGTGSGRISTFSTPTNRLFRPAWTRGSDQCLGRPADRPGMLWRRRLQELGREQLHRARCPRFLLQGGEEGLRIRG